MNDIIVSSFDKLTPDQQRFVDTLFECEGILAHAYKKLGINTIRMTDELANAIRDRAVLMMAQEVPLALANLSAVLKGDPKTFLSATARIKAAESLLDRTGLSKVERVHVTADNNSLVILPAKNPVKD